MSSAVFTLASLRPALPEIALATCACALLMIDVFAGQTRRGLTAVAALVALALTAWLTLGWADVGGRELLFSGLYVADPLAVVLKLAALVTTGFALVYGERYLERRAIHGGEYYVLALTALLGVFVLASANSLLTVYLGVELLSLSLYALVAFDRESGIAAEAAMKYFVLGAIASGVLLYGMSLLYGLTGTLDLDQLAAASTRAGAGFTVGLAFIVAAVAFKFGAVPFHMWVPDVYQGAPSSVALFIATVSKFGSFALALRLLAHGLGHDPESWTPMVAAIVAASLVFGNLVAIAQTNLRRLLAYSAIANVGFVLAGFVTASVAGYRAALAYTLIYVLTTLGSFGVLLLAARRDADGDDLVDFKGLATRDPLLAWLMLIVMLSTAGVPPFAGFWAKLWIVQALIGAHLWWLAILAMAVSVVGAFYYLRVVWYMFFEPAAEAAGAPIDREPLARGALAINCLAVLALGALPNVLLALCTRLIV